MQKDQWEQKMFQYFHDKLLKGSPFGQRFEKAGLIIRYLQEEIKTAEWETIALNQEYNVDKKAFVNVGAPPEDPLQRRSWDAERRKARQLAEQRIRSGTGKKCPVCGSWNTERVAPEDQPKNILLPISAYHDFLVCKDCSSRVMWESQELEVVHDTEVIIKCDILSKPFSYKGVMQRMRYPALDVWRVNGTHASWKDEEVRKMMYTMWMEETRDVWLHESQVGFEAAYKRLQSESKS
jgi:hypothetical protein